MASMKCDNRPNESVCGILRTGICHEQRCWLIALRTSVYYPRNFLKFISNILVICSQLSRDLNTLLEPNHPFKLRMWTAWHFSSITKDQMITCNPQSAATVSFEMCKFARKINVCSILIKNKNTVSFSQYLFLNYWDLKGLGVLQFKSSRFTKRKSSSAADDWI